MRKLLASLKPSAALGAITFIALALVIYLLGQLLGGDAGSVFVAVMGLLIGRSAGKHLMPLLDARSGR